MGTTQRVSSLMFIRFGGNSRLAGCGNQQAEDSSDTYATTDHATFA
jgi:hypothetical protein